MRWVLFLFLIAPAAAWDWDAHRHLAEKVCEHYDCRCMDEIVDGSMIPDRDFKDFSSHSCYSSPCTDGAYWDCPVRKDCPAMEKAKEWMMRAASAQGCERWKYVGIASHYFFDARCFWHQVTNEDYERCHKPFEDDVGRKIGLAEWKVCKCDVCVSSKDFERWLEEFYVFTASYLSAEPPSTSGQKTVTPPPQIQKLKEKIPGFETVTAILALLFVLRRKGKKRGEKTGVTN